MPSWDLFVETWTSNVVCETYFPYNYVPKYLPSCYFVVYLNYGDSDKINLDIFMMADGGQTWDILVTQIKCNSPDLGNA